MAARCFLTEFDGTLIVEVSKPSVEGECSWERRGPGQCVTSMPSTDPAVVELVHSSPADGVVFRTGWDTDLELAWWRDGLTPGTDPPTWVGPVVAVSHRWGTVTVTAFGREWYLVRSVLGGPRVELLPQGHFADDSDLSEWTATEKIGYTGELVAETVTSPVYSGSGARSAHLVAGTLVTYADLDTFDAEAPLDVVVVYQIDAGDDPGQPTDRIIAELVVETDDGGGWDPLPSTARTITLPEAWSPNTWIRGYVKYEPDDSVPTGDPLRLKITLHSSYALTVLQEAQDVWFDPVSVTQSAWAGADADDDVAEVPRSVLTAAAALMPGTWTVDVDDTGVLLTEAVRYWADDHEDVLSILGDWDPHGEWWVEGSTLRWAATRGSLISSVTLDEETMSAWSYEIDAAAAATEMIGQSAEDVEGPREEAIVTVSGAPNRLVVVDQATAGLVGADLIAWATEALAKKGPACALSGQPVVLGGSPGDLLDDLVLGGWADITIADPPMNYTVQPTIDRLSWHPRADVVSPEWVIGERRPDLAEIAAATKRATERDRRRRRVAGPLAAFRKVEEVTTGLDEAGLVIVPVTLTAGLWDLVATYYAELDDAAAVQSIGVYTEEGPVAVSRAPGSKPAIVTVSATVGGGTYAVSGGMEGGTAVPDLVRVTILGTERRT